MKRQQLNLAIAGVLCLQVFACAQMAEQPSRARSAPKNNYPRFSWDTVPVYQMFGDDSRLLTGDEVRRIAASSDFVCIEKSHGQAVLGSAELGAMHEAKRFKAVKPSITVLFYWNSSVAYPFTSFAREFAVPTGCFSELAKGKKLSDERRAWLVIDPKTGDLATRDGHVYYFDVLNAGFREWWSSTVGKVVRESDCDGFFLDQLHSASWFRPGKRKEIGVRMGQMMTMAKEAMGPDGILLANNGAADYLDVADAFMFEHYGDSLMTREAIVADWELMKRIAAAGKISVYRMPVDLKGTGLEKPTRGKSPRARMREIGEISRKRIDFPLACYLIGAQPRSYFCYNWGWELTTGPLVDYPEFRKPLGKPRGEFVRATPRGWTFTREFAHASVWLDLDKRQARIDWK